jgi:peptide deformylase
VVVEVPDDLSQDIQPMPLTVIFNPQLEFLLKHEKIQMWESCLSVPGLVGKVTRYNNVIMHFLGQDGKKKRLAATGFLAGVIQHETDHLWGKLFIDRLASLNDLAFEEEWQTFHAQEKGICNMGSFKMYDLE